MMGFHGYMRDIIAEEVQKVALEHDAQVREQFLQKLGQAITGNTPRQEPAPLKKAGDLKALFKTWIDFYKGAHQDEEKKDAAARELVSKIGKGPEAIKSMAWNLQVPEASARGFWDQLKSDAHL